MCDALWFISITHSHNTVPLAIFFSLFLVVIRYFVHLISGSFYSLFHSISLLFMFFVSSMVLLLSVSRCVNFIERQLNSRSWKRKNHFAMMMMKKEKRMYWAVWFFIKHEATTTEICWTSQRFHIVHHTHTHTLGATTATATAAQDQQQRPYVQNCNFIVLLSLHLPTLWK